jgi:hypothetical protein
LQIIKRIVHFNGPFFTDNLSSLLFCILGIGFIYLVEFKKEFYNNLFTISNNKNWLVRNAYHCLLLMIILLAGVFDGGQFIYFQF